MGFSLGGFLSGSKAKSRETMSSEYLKSVRTPKSMEVPDWAKTMTEEFMRSFYGPEYYARITGTDMLPGADLGSSPYQKAMEGAYDEVRAAKQDTLDYLNREKGVVPEATKESLSKYSNLLSTMLERSLAGEAVIPEIGLPDTGFAGLLDRLTSPVSIGLEGQGGMSFVPKGSAEALKELFSGRASALDQLKGWGSERAEMDIIPALTRDAYAREPLDYALSMAEQTPVGGSLLQQLGDMRSMWAPVSETAMQLGGQVPLITESESVDAVSKAQSSALGGGLSLGL